jgi:hypothetical protein
MERLPNTDNKTPPSTETPGYKNLKTSMGGNPFKTTDQILQEEAQDQASESQERQHRLRSAKGKYALAIIPLAAVIAGIVFLPKAFSTNPQLRPYGPVGTVTTSSGGTTSGTPWYKQKDATFTPIALPGYATSTAPADFGTLGLAQQHYAYSELANSPLLTKAALHLGSTTAGYSSNVGKSTLGTSALTNQHYAFWTQQLFLTQSSDILERLLNPIYGGWTQDQQAGFHASQFSLKPFGEYLTGAYARRVSKDKTSFPIFANWKQNYKGTSLPPANAPHWFGNISKANATYSVSHKTGVYSSDATYRVTFTAFDKSQNRVTRQGVLSVDWVSNGRAFYDSKAPRVLINSAQLTVSK